MDDQLDKEFSVNFVPVSSHLNWDEYFMLQAMLASYKSKDPHTKVGCVFVDENNHQITMGYNGIIAGSSLFYSSDGIVCQHSILKIALVRKV